MKLADSYTCTHKLYLGSIVSPCLSKFPFLRFCLIYLSLFLWISYSTNSLFLSFFFSLDFILSYFIFVWIILPRSFTYYSFLFFFFSFSFSVFFFPIFSFNFQLTKFYLPSFRPSILPSRFISLLDS